MRFEFATATRIVFGAGTLAQIGPAAREFGRRALIVTGRDSSRAARLVALLARAEIAPSTYAVPHEPTIGDITQGVAAARAAHCDLVIGFGGGAALDTAKAISALLTNTGDILDYLEVIGRAQPLACAAAPCITIPTTAGTGAEVTRNAVLGSPAHRVKVSLRSPLLLPRLALVDPELTHGLPPAVTAASGLDAFTQLLEPFLSSRANPLTDALCRDGLVRIARSLRRAFAHGNDAAAREDLSLASLHGGLALANAGLGAVHGFAGPIGGMFPAPHGAVCAALLAPVMRANLAALRARAPHLAALARFHEASVLLTRNAHAAPEDGLRWIQDLVADLHIPPLSTYGLTASDAPSIVEATARSSSMKANPLPLTTEELHAALLAAL